MSTFAQTYGDEGPTLTPNAFGLVYEDAISENVPGQVNLHRVNYTIDGIDVVAHVYTPAGYDAKKSYAGIVVAHPNGGSKDQVAGIYAQKLAEAGFVTLAFDARYQGESGGMPRRTDKPAGFMNWTPEEARQIKVDLYRDGYFYYGVTHKSPNAPGTYLKSSLMDMMAWDATDHADLIEQPLLIIAGEIADSRYMSEEAFVKATSTADKELFIVPGATHIRTYFVKEYVDQITAKIRQFFTEKL